MGTVTAQQILDKASIELQDVAKTRWTSDEMLSWLNEGQLELVRMKPTANAVTRNVSLDAGKTKQVLPSDSFLLINVVRNMGDGSTPGNVIRMTTKEVLDASAPTWHSADNTLGYVTHYANDIGDPRAYYVHPKAPDSALYIEVVLAKVPDTLTLSSVIEMFDIYAKALSDYVCFRCLAKEDEAGAAAKAQAFYQLFTAALA